MDRTRYQRFFHMLHEEDKGYGTSGACNGYVKIEIKDGKGKLQAFAQNLRDPEKGTSYAVYFIKAGDASALPIRMGILEMQKNKGELVAQFDPDSIKNTGISIEKIGAFAILFERNGGYSGNLICPLAAINDVKIDWKLQFHNIPMQKQVAERKIEPVPIKLKENRAVQIKEDKIREEIKEEIKEIKEDIKKEDIAEVEAERVNLPDQKPEIPEDTEQKAIKEEERVEIYGNTAAETIGYTETLSADTEPQIDADTPAAESFMKQAGPERADIKSGAASDLTKSRELLQSNKPAINNIQIEGDSKSDINMLERVKEALGRHFEEFQPFQRRRFSYRWWKVNNPVFLNNVLYVNRVKSPIFFNPLVIMAHFKHKHIIMGIYTDRQTDKEYIVCGTPGIYGIDERPFGDLCKWVPKEGERPRYGGYGYWVVYIDPSTGRLVTI